MVSADLSAVHEAQKEVIRAGEPVSFEEAYRLMRRQLPLKRRIIGWFRTIFGKNKPTST